MVVKKIFLGYLIVYFLLAMIMVFLVGTRQIEKYNALTKQGVHAVGIVIETNCFIHNQFIFEYSTGFLKHDVQDSNPSCGQLRVGQSINVIYAPQDPAVATSRNPALALRNEVIFFFFSVLLAPFLVVAVFLAALPTIKARLY